MHMNSQRVIRSISAQLQKQQKIQTKQSNPIVIFLQNREDLVSRIRT